MQTHENYSKVALAMMEALRGRFAEPSLASLCVAYVCLKARENNVVDIPDLAVFLDRSAVPSGIRDFIVKTLDGEWNAFRPLITSHDLESLRMFIASRDLDSRRYAFPVSDHIQRLALKLIGLSSEDSFADFRCDIGSSLLLALQEFGVKVADGYEIQEDNATVAEMRLDAIGGDFQAQIVRRNLFAIDPDVKRYDKIYCCPPLSLRIMDSDTRAYVSSKAALPELRPSCSMTWIFALRALDSLRERGQCVMIVNDGSLLNQAELPCRKYLLDRNLVETVISLPSPVFAGTGVAASIVVLNPCKQGSSVLTVDASKEGRKGKGTVALSDHDINAIVNVVRNGCTDGNIVARSVEPREIARDEYILHPRRYINTDAVELEFPNAKPLKELVSKIKTGSSLSARDLADLTVAEQTKFRYATQANIQDGMLGKGVTYLREMPQAKGSHCAFNGDVILTKAGRPIKSAVASLEHGESLLVGSNQYIITPKQKEIDPFYLKAFFDSAMGQSVLSQISVGGGMPAIALRDLYEIKIPVLPIEVQKKISATYLARQQEVDELRGRLDRSLSALNCVFDEIATSVGADS